MPTIAPDGSPNGLGSAEDDGEAGDDSDDDQNIEQHVFTTFASGPQVRFSVGGCVTADRDLVSEHIREGDIVGVARDVLDGRMGTAHSECDRALALLAQGVLSLSRADAKHQRRLVNVGQHVIAIVDKNKGLKLDVRRLEDLLVWIYRKAPPIEEIRTTLDRAIRTRIAREREEGRL